MIDLIKYWKPLAIALLAFSLFAYIEYIKSQRDDARQKIAEMQQEALKQYARVQLLTEQGKRDTASLQANHIKDIQHIGSLYGKALNDDKKSIDSYRTQLANQLRHQSKGSDSGMPKDDSHITSSDDSNAALARQPEDSDTDYRMMYLGAIEHIKTLKQAGAVCASDYNTCKAHLDSEEKRIGVYSER